MAAVASAGAKPILATHQPAPMNAVKVPAGSPDEGLVVEQLHSIEKTLEGGLSLKDHEVEAAFSLLFTLAERKGLSPPTVEVLGKVFYNAFAASCNYTPEGRNDNPVLVPLSIRTRAFALCRKLLRDEDATIPFRKIVNMSLPYIMNHPEISYADQRSALVEMSPSFIANSDRCHTAYETCCKLEHWDFSLKQLIAKNLLNDRTAQKRTIQIAKTFQAAAQMLEDAKPFVRLGVVHAAQQARFVQMTAPVQTAAQMPFDAQPFIRLGLLPGQLPSKL